MGGFLHWGLVYIYYTMQYEISGSVLAGQITTTTWAGAPSRTWAWSRAIGGAGRGIGGAGQFASWTRAAQLRTSTWAEAAVARATVPPRRSTLRWTCPGRALGEGSGGPGHGTPPGVQLCGGPAQGGSARDVGLGGGSVEDLGPQVARTPYMSRCSFLRSCDHSARGNLSLSAVVARLDVSYM